MRLALIAGGAAIILTAPAQSAEATIITLACHGKFTTVSATSDAKPKPVPVSKMGLVVNVPERSVAGFEEFERAAAPFFFLLTLLGVRYYTLRGTRRQSLVFLGDLQRCGLGHRVLKLCSQKLCLLGA
jgi:hypothetical protein